LIRWQGARSGSLAAHEGGNVLTVVALSLVALLGFAGLAVDTGLWYAGKSEAQSAADAAAISAAKALSVPGATAADVEAAANFAAGLNSTDSDGTAVAVETVGKRVTVSVSRPVPSFFSKMITHEEVSVSARAVVEVDAATAEQRRVCIIVLDPNMIGAINLYGARLTGRQCEVHVHSNNLLAILALPLGKLSATRVCVAGGVIGTLLLVIPVLDLNCTPVPDPFGGHIPLPEIPAPCANDSGATLDPGRYCNGINGDKTLNPGAYIVDGGSVGNGTITGDGVTIILRNEALLRMSGNDKLDITAPTSGPYKGVAIFEDDTRKGTTASLVGNADLVVEGAIYLPKSKLTFSGNSSGGINSPWTLIVVRELDFNGRPEIAVTADYGSGSVPPPEALRTTFTFLE